jgi:ferric-dicitrate binding protein FerR (iron transport regulator)
MHLQELFEGRLMGDDLEELQHELRTNPEAKDVYCDYAHLHNALQLRNEGIDSLNVIPMDQAVQRDRRRSFRTAMLVSVAVLMIIGVVMSLFIARTPPPTLRFSTSPGTGLTISHQLTGEGAPEGQVLEPGSRLEIRHGTVELEFASGVRGIVHGPANLTLLDEGLLELDRGTAWFEVSSKATGFQVNTPDLTLIDLGTEFGIRSRPDFLDEVHVFTGKVEVRNRYGLKKGALLVAGQARVAGPAGRWQETPLRRDHFLTELPSTEPKLANAELISIAPGNVTVSSTVVGLFNRIDDHIVNGHGLDGGQHTNAVKGNMWLSSGTEFGGDDPDPFVIFDLGAIYTIGSFHVWNYNENPPNLTGRGVNRVSVEYGTTPDLGSTVTGITNFAEADGTSTYPGESFEKFPPFKARYIKFDINSNHGSDNNFYGLSEVQFYGELVPEPDS